MYLAYEEIAVSNTVKDADDLEIPAEATHVELRASGNAIRYTMDGETAPTTILGMLMLVADAPKTFLVTDLNNIQFIRDASTDAELHLHYFNGR